MKKYFIVTFFILFIFFTAGCSAKKETVSAFGINEAVAVELEQIENIENLDDETLKALSIVIRTKKQNENFTKTEYKPKNEHIYNIVKETNGLTIKNQEKLANVSYHQSNTWHKEINKYEILKYLAKKNISLSNISNISPVYDKDGTLKEIYIAGKTISYEELKKEFDIPTNNIKNISFENNKIIIDGFYNKEHFFIEQADILSKKGIGFKGIINHFYGNFTVN